MYERSWMVRSRGLDVNIAIPLGGIVLICLQSKRDEASLIENMKLLIELIQKSFLRGILTKSDCFELFGFICLMESGVRSHYNREVGKFGRKFLFSNLFECPWRQFSAGFGGGFLQSQRTYLLLVKGDHYTISSPQIWNGYSLGNNVGFHVSLLKNKRNILF